MTEAPERCAHEGCTCAATEGEYCGDFCREHAGHAEDACGCGHADCAGTVAGSDSSGEAVPRV